MANPVGSAARRVEQVVRAAAAAPHYGAAIATVLARTRVLGPYWPGQVRGAVQAVHRHGATLGGVYAAEAALHGGRVAVYDDAGPASFSQVDQQSNTIAAALADRGTGPDSCVGLLCRDHRGLLNAILAVAKVGADTVYLNTGFAAPQLADVARRERITTLIVDQEFLPLTAGLDLPVWVAWADQPSMLDPAVTLEGLLVGSRRAAPSAPGRMGRQVVLTSGTTDPPQGAKRRTSVEPTALLALLSRIPYRGGDVTLIAAPMFHSWGLINVGLGIIRASTLVLPRFFDAEDVLRRVAAHRVRVLVVVPVMLQRILDLPAEVRGRYDLSSLEVVASSGSALSAELSTDFMDTFGDVIYNVYGSTEVGWVSVADPKDLRAAAGTGGRRFVDGRVTSPSSS